jgi:hypothetical protein
MGYGKVLFYDRRRTISDKALQLFDEFTNARYNGGMCSAAHLNLKNFILYSFQAIAVPMLKFPY